MAKYHKIPIWVLRDWFRYDPETGDIYRLAFGRRWKKVINTQPYDYHNIGIYIKPYGRSYIHAHTLAWVLYYGHWPRQTIDHINFKKSDNRIANLRDVPLSVNVLSRIHREYKYDEDDDNEQWMEVHNVLA
jgi:hypothetical protein